ncbi:radical SAM protein, partial [Candidatus Magnetaquicoccus inordinatus]|uniref:radical SAM protein n=1 Tax=Candidatus Magnetaquicoccus inordinatus TaxID=2496818 RepID=UPI00102D0BEA
MFRLTQLLRQLLQKESTQSRQRSHGGRWQGPVVVWNLLRRCNLQCRHCYSGSADRDFQGELSREEIFRVLQDLHDCAVPAIILSGGEPLLHPDLFAIAQRAKEMGFYLGLSSNGTLMDARKAEEIQQVGFDYVGVSLDGLELHHDRNRMQEGAFRQALSGIRACQQQGVKVGIR